MSVPCDLHGALPEISTQYILRRAPPATHLNHPLISRRKESNLDKSLKIMRPRIDRKVSLSAPAPRVKNICMWRRRAPYAALTPNSEAERHAESQTPSISPKYTCMTLYCTKTDYNEKRKLKRVLIPQRNLSQLVFESLAEQGNITNKIN